MALHGLFCADVPLRNYALTHSLTHSLTVQLRQLLAEYSLKLLNKHALFAQLPLIF